MRRQHHDLTRTNTITAFTLIELIAVIVVLGVLASFVSSRFIATNAIELQATRDSLVSAIFHAQQRAMAQVDAVQLSTTANSVDIRQDTDQNNVFSANESIRVGAIQYPIQFDPGISVSSNTQVFDRLGQTSQTSFTLTKSNDSVVVTVNESGFAQ